MAIPFLRRWALLIALAGACTTAQAQPYSDLYVFGDSLTDMGNRGLAPYRPDVKFRQTWVAQLAGPSMLGIAGFKSAPTIDAAPITPPIARAE